MANLIEVQQKAKRAQAFGTLMNDYSQNSSEAGEVDDPQEALLCEMLEASAQAKVFHWQTSSFSEHKALNKFYDEFNELMDDFIESYQGCYGRIMMGCDMDIKPYTLDAPITFLEEFKAYISSEARMLVIGNSALTNILDNINALVEQTIFRLTLK